MDTQKPIYTVSQLNSEVKHLLESAFNTVCLIGEISNFVQSQAGHAYFSLKDRNTQVRCALFSRTASQLKFALENGQQILIQARVSLYEARGDFQLIIQHVEAVGDGALQRAFEQLKKKLALEGLFAPEHKKPLPTCPQTIGVITSPTGAAIRDILHVLSRRCPSIRIIIYPTLVQGQQAAEQIAKMLQIANQRNECDLLILARGGGSLEDLWPFNEEIVARAIFDSQLPIVTGVGHEIDFTIADFVADHRAPTPSAAAECTSPDSAAWQRQLQQHWQRLVWLIQHHIQQKQQTLTTLKQRLRHPQQQLNEYQQRLQQLRHQFQFAMAQHIKSKQQNLQALAQQLNAISPLNTLKRGYAIASDSNNHVITDAQAITEQDVLQLRLAHGKLVCRVEKTL